MNTHITRVLERAGRTALQVVVGYLATAGTIGAVDWTTAALAAALAVVVAVLQGMVDLPPLPQTWMENTLGRALRTFGQAALGSVGAAVLVTDVPWEAVLSASALAAITSVVTSIVTTPVGPRGTPEIVGPAPAGVVS